MKKNTLVSMEYGAAQALYWMKYAASVSFTAVYLQSLGFSNSGIGLVFGIGYVLGFLVSNLLGSWIDRFENVSASKAIGIGLGVEALMLLYTMFFGKNDVVTVTVYGLFICGCMCIGGFLTKQWADLDHNGYSVNFGVTRAVGSLGYAVMAAIMGVVVEKWGIQLIFPITLGTVAAGEAVNLLLSKHTDSVSRGNQSFERGDSIFAFIKNNGSFCLLLCGIMLIFFSYRVPNDYMINVVSAIGGNTAGMGALHAFNAVVEIPTMVLYRRIGKRFSEKLLMIVAVIGFTVKILGETLAPSMPWLFAAVAIQCVGYALYTPAIVDYVNRHVPFKDSAKGQLLANGMTTLGAVFSSVTGGLLFDRISVKNTLAVATVISAAGTAICIVALLMADKKKRGQKGTINQPI